MTFLAVSKRGSRNNTEKTIYGTTELMELWSRMPFLKVNRKKSVSLALCLPLARMNRIVTIGKTNKTEVLPKFPGRPS